MTTNDYTKTSKNDLIAAVVARGLVKNKTAARDMRADVLRALLAESDTANRAALREAIDPTPTRAPKPPEDEVLVEPRYVAPGAPEAHKSLVGFEPTLPENAGAHRAPVALVASVKKPRVRLTAQQRANKLTRNRRRHKRAVARARHGWANGQQTAREAVRAALAEDSLAEYSAGNTSTRDPILRSGL